MCHCGSSFVHACVRDVSQTEATAAFGSGKAQRSSLACMQYTAARKPMSCVFHSRIIISRRPSAGRLNGFSGDAQGDKESINPSQHTQPPFGTFLILIFFVPRGEVALVFSCFFSVAASRSTF